MQGSLEDCILWYGTERGKKIYDYWEGQKALIALKWFFREPYKKEPSKLEIWLDRLLNDRERWEQQAKELLSKIRETSCS